MFIDEPQDCVAGHPERAITWQDFVLRTSKLKMQRNLTSASIPPHLLDVFCKNFALIPGVDVDVIRGSTDRPELGYHIMTVDQSLVPIWESLKRLIFHLKGSIQRDERIVVFFQDEADADRFATETRCAKYHSKLPKEGHNKEYYVDLWTRGTNVVMAASTAFQQGVDYPWVSHVVYFKSAYGLMDFQQGSGRAGRRGCFGHVVLLRDKRDHLNSKWARLGDVEDTRCEHAFSQLACNEKFCTRYIILYTMDGRERAISCGDNPGCNLCGVCDPNSAISQFIRWAVNTPMPPQPSSAPAPKYRWEDEYGELEFTKEMAQAMDEAVVPHASEVN
jgi:superfamily II DNA helicase RecQ